MKRGEQSFDSIESLMMRASMADRKKAEVVVVDEKASKDPLRIFIGTWNVNAKPPSHSDGLLGWIMGGRKRDKRSASKDDADDDPPLPDIFVFGMQEVVTLQAQNVVKTEDHKRRKRDWVRYLLNVINSVAATVSVGRKAGDKIEACDEYVMVGKKMMMGLVIIVFTKRRHADSGSVCLIGTSSVAAGFGGTVGNKGAVGVAISCSNHSVGFLCAHLAAGRDKVDARKQNVEKIFDSMRFKALSSGADNDHEHDENGHPSSPTTFPSTPTTPRAGATIRVSDLSSVFFFGDLNYRIDDRLSNDEIYKEIERKPKPNIALLTAHDQLTLARARGDVLRGFREGKIDFLPTYKFVPGGGPGAWDRAPDGKKRAPAWCDRILWRLDTTAELVLQYYASCPDERMSDHKPVSAEFVLRPHTESHNKKLLVRHSSIEDMHKRKAIQKQVDEQNRFVDATSIRKEIEEHRRTRSSVDRAIESWVRSDAASKTGDATSDDANDTSRKNCRGCAKKFGWFSERVVCGICSKRYFCSACAPKDNVTEVLSSTGKKKARACLRCKPQGELFRQKRTQRTA